MEYFLYEVQELHFTCYQFKKITIFKNIEEKLFHKLGQTFNKNHIRYYKNTLSRLIHYYKPFYGSFERLSP